MKIIPAIDILDGKVVRLHKGDYDASTEYSNSPLEQLTDYADAGAKLVHIVDLDAAKKGEFVNRTVLEGLIHNSPVKLQVAGGIRSEKDLQDRLYMGINRVVIGSMVVNDTDAFCVWLKKYGADRLVAAVDVKKNESGDFIPQVHGWTESSNITLFELLDELVANGLKHLLCTDIDKDGTLEGPSFALYAEIQNRYPDLVLQASGGISSLDDLEKLVQMKLPEAISGKAILDGRIDLSDAISQFSHT